MTSPHSKAGTDIILSQWVAATEAAALGTCASNITPTNVSFYTSTGSSNTDNTDNTTNCTPGGELEKSIDDSYAAGFASGTLLMVIGVLTGSYLFCFGGERVSNKVHADCIKAVMFAPYSWYLENPIGRVTSRFSSDLSIVDLYLASEATRILR